jgi:hypothetical protein
MRERTVRAREKDSLAQSLGWLSLGLGTAAVAAPRTMCRAVGASDVGAAPTLMRMMGAREIVQGVGILTRPRPTLWMWSRVAGDTLDLSLLALTAVTRPEHRLRTAVAMTGVAALALPDVLESRHLGSRTGEPQRGMLVRKTVTINRRRQEVEDAWVAAEVLRRKVDEAGAFASFLEAPGGRGTELAVELVYAPPAGDLGALAQKLTGNDLPTELADGLRRLKQAVETGEVVRSDSTPDGHLLAAHVRQRPAQPLAEAAR